MLVPLIEKLVRHEDLTASEAAAAMHEVMEGRVAPAALASLLTALVMKGERPAEIVETDCPGQSETSFGLTPREREVLALLCQRLTDREIADALFVSPRTAGFHVSNVLSKIGAANRREAAALATHYDLT